MCQAIPPMIASKAPKAGMPITHRRRQRAHASVFNVRRASLSDGRRPRLASTDRKMSRARPSGIAAAHPSVAHVEESAPGSTAARRVRSRFARFFIPRPTRFSTRCARVRRTLAAETKSWFRNAHNSTARRCLGERLSSARSISGATRVHKSASGGNALRGLPEIHSHSRDALSTELSAGDRRDVEQPACQDSCLPQLARAPGQNEEHRARHLPGVVDAARAPERQ